ncbi:MAG: hypothetical protein ABEJ02_00600 [Candidatus Paceibacteria bacterium]
MKVIEFLGMPKNGKTTIWDKLKKKLKREGYEVGEIYEAAQVNCLDKNDSFEYHTWNINTMLSELLERVDKKSYFDFVLLDRGIYDSLVFTRALHEAGKITKNQKRGTEKYLKQFLHLVDGAVLFHDNPGHSLSKDYDEEGRVINEGFLYKLYRQYDELKLPSDSLILNTSEFNPNVEKIKKFILE